MQPGPTLFISARLKLQPSCSKQGQNSNVVTSAAGWSVSSTQLNRQMSFKEAKHKTPLLVFGPFSNCLILYEQKHTGSKSFCHLSFCQCFVKKSHKRTWLCLWQHSKQLGSKERTQSYLLLQVTCITSSPHEKPFLPFKVKTGKWDLVWFWSHPAGASPSCSDSQPNMRNTGVQEGRV